ncbi:glycosyl hydrolase 115 family protein [Paenibacillus oryzisoli]|uniref:glycosyl hydrolase 115 family protein n=1 Tax=Paenibacillus oryzisoli TaxID=1850517 RepID=UPI003D2ABE29
MKFTIDQHTTYRIVEDPPSAVRYAWEMVKRDHERVLGGHPAVVTKEGEAADVVIRYAELEDRCPERPEAFCFRFVENRDSVELHIVAGDELGLVYGMLAYSEQYLGVHPFWFWTDALPERKSRIDVSTEDYVSPAAFVRFRGWFVNDEVCLIGWKEEYPPTREVWQPVFETLLRCGGNMVIPGTDLPKHGIHNELAAEMGLWVTHHHAEPLGAEMFSRAHPDRQASYQQEPELFEALWAEAIQKQKDKKIVWVLSFRGQGDSPFWKHDPSFDTPEKRGAMISKVIQRQHEMIKSEVADPICCVALYGEISELYKGGHISVPEGVIQIWADNGYGTMVSRRNGNENLRIPALPEEGAPGKHGIYYHVTFHDLQASNHLTLYPGSAEYVKEEVEKAFNARATEYVLVNSGNIRPHVYTLDVLRELWQQGTVDVEAHRAAFVQRYFPAYQSEIADLYRIYAEASIPYGPFEDDLAGDEFYHHPARIIIGHWLRGDGDQADRRLQWAAGDVPFAEQVRYFGERGAYGLESWGHWLAQCDELLAKLSEENQRQQVIDQLRFHGELHHAGSEGLMWLGKAFEAYNMRQLPQAFVLVSRSLWAYQRGVAALRNSERGKWADFYRADWLTNLESTAWNVDTLRRFLRVHGDSPDFFLWYKQYLMPETEKHIYLENTHREPLTDDALAECLLKKLFE